VSTSLARGVLQTVGGSASVAAVSLIRNVLIARVMGPAAFGIWNVCLVAHKIAVESHLGALSIVSVESPMHRGAGDEQRARSVERTGVAATLAFGVVAGAAAALVLRAIAGPELDTAALLLALGIALQQTFFAETTVLRSRRRFGGISIGQGAFAAVYLAGLLWLLPTYFITGALAAGIAGLVVAIAAAGRHTPAAFPRPRLAHLTGLATLLRRGAAVYLVQLTLALMLQVDRVIVGALLGQEALGHYGILVLGGNALLFVPAAVADVLWPMAGESFGRARLDPAVLGPLARMALTQLSLLLLVLLPFVLACMDGLVAHVLPQYAPALPALRIYVAGLFPLAVVMPLRNVLLTVGGGGALLKMQAAALVGVAALRAGAIAVGYGLVGVAAAGAGGWSLLLVLALWLVKTSGVLSGRAVAAGGALAALCLAAALGLDAAINALAPPVATVEGAVTRLVVTGVAAAATAWVLIRRARHVR